MKVLKWKKLADEQSIDRTIKGLKKRGINAIVVDTKEDAFEKLKEMLPKEAEIMTAGSTTLEQIGLIELLKSGKHSWNNLKDAILAEKDAKKQNELRKKSASAQYYIGSVHAVAQTGELVIASASGSQIPAYVLLSDNVIWIVGSQKIVRTLNEAVKRVRECCLPLEDKRMRSIGYSGSTIGKLLIFEREINPSRKLTVIFVKEELGF